MFQRRALRRRLASAGAGCVPERAVRGLARALERPAAADCVTGPPALRTAALRVARWPDLKPDEILRRIPLCSEDHCCNPHHYSRLAKPDTPPPPYTPYAMDDVKRKEDVKKSDDDARRTDHERSPPGSLATDGEEKASWDREWCRLAYWELARRVGRQVGVRPRAVDVFGAGAGGRHGLCLDSLADVDSCITDQVRKTRSKIGLGVTLSREPDGVWLYNRSKEPVFVSSPALDAAAARALLVWRVAPGYCLCIFDPSAPDPVTSLPQMGPVDPRSVRISFAKGWGPKYSRRDVTACPCWLEVLLAPPS